MSGDFYFILGVAQDATPTAIKRAFRRRARELHPDAGGTAEAFSELKAACDYLLDPEKRIQYDRSRTERSEARQNKEKLAALLSFALDQTLLRLNQNIESVSLEEISSMMADRLAERRADFTTQRKQLLQALKTTTEILNRQGLRGDIFRDALNKRKLICEDGINKANIEINLIDLVLKELQENGASIGNNIERYGIDIYDVVI